MKVQMVEKNTRASTEIAFPDVEVSKPDMYTGHRHVVTARSSDLQTFVELAFTDYEWDIIRKAME